MLLERAGWEERAAVCDMATDLLLQRDLPFVISARVMSREQHERLVSLERLPPREIERDGIPL